jgi:hypothetical protein
MERLMGITTVPCAWTAHDEALYQELAERKLRVLTERRQAVVDLLRMAPEGDFDSEVTDYLIARASDFIAALQPFCK